MAIAEMACRGRDLRMTTPQVQGSPSFFNATSRHGVLKRSLASRPGERAGFWSLQPPARREREGLDSPNVSVAEQEIGGACLPSGCNL